MFGKNPIRKQHLRGDGALVVQEIFPTLQGEGPFAGHPAIFVRLAGCNLRCWFCDTEFESGMQNPPMGVGALLREIARAREACKTNLIVLSGGEPFRQNIVPLIAECIKRDMQVQIETAGTLWLDGGGEADPYPNGLIDIYYWCGESLTIVCSPKTPMLNTSLWDVCGHFKYIISADEPLASDGLPFARAQQQTSTSRVKLARPRHGAQVWVQACDRGSPADRERAQQRCAQIAMSFGYALSLQQHKILGLP